MMCQPKHPPVVGSEFALKLGDQRCLASPIGADEGMRFARPHLERQAV